MGGVWSLTFSCQHFWWFTGNWSEIWMILFFDSVLLTNMSVVSPESANCSAHSTSSTPVNKDVIWLLVLRCRSAASPLRPHRSSPSTTGFWPRSSRRGSSAPWVNTGPNVGPRPADPPSPTLCPPISLSLTALLFYGLGQKFSVDISQSETRAGEGPDDD